MKRMLPRLRNLPRHFTTAIALLVGAAGPALAANKTWDGGGADGNWTTGGNWDANTAPAGGDSLIFGGTLRLNNTNNFPVGTGFGGITFNSPAGAFVLNGSSINLNGNITDNQPIVTEAINLPLVLTGDRSVNVANNAAVSIGAAISGGFGLAKNGGGLLTLNEVNLYSGGTHINGGTLSISADNNLGTVPGVVTPGSLVISNGVLRGSGSFVLDARRGIAIGPVSGSGSGTILTPIGSSVTYGGTIANNGGTGGLNKSGFGSLSLAGPNTYSGATTVKIGTLILDFAPVTAPANHIISSSSSLALGGETAGAGTTNFAALIVNGLPGGASSQSFASTTVDLGAAQIRANSGSGGSANINLGNLTHNLGGVVNVIPPSLIGGAGEINTTAQNNNGIVGGWAMISSGVVALQGGTTGNPIPPAVATNFATVDVSGNLTSYTNHTVYAAGDVRAIAWATNNLLVNTPTGDLRVDLDNAGSLSDVNTITFFRNLQWSLNIGQGNTLRLGKTGALFSQLHTASPTWGISSCPGTVANLNQQGHQDVGTLTAGGPNDNTPGEIIIHLSQAGSGSANNMVIDAKVTDNGTGPVTVVKAGPGFFKLRGHNTYSGGTYVLQGRVQLSGSEVGTSNPDGLGTGPLVIFPGGYLFFAGAGSPVTNAMFIAGDAARQEQGIGAIRTAGNWRVDGQVTLIGDATIGGNGGVSGRIAGKITGNFNLNLCSAGTVNGTISISNPNNDWTGTTTIQARDNTGANTFINGDSEIIPHGFGYGNVVMRGFSAGTVTWNLNGFNETVNGLSTVGTGPNCMIVNNGATASTLTVGDNDQSGTFSGVMQDGSAALALTKIGGGAFTLSEPNTYTGDTTVNGGTLALLGAATLASQKYYLNGGTLDLSETTAGFAAAGPVGVNNGTFVAGTVNATMPSLSLTNSGLTVTLHPGKINFETSSLATGGATNRINIASVVNISGYPTEPITVIDYSGTIGGVGHNFGLGTVPSSATVGYVSNDIVNSRIVVVLLNGPKPLTWRGSSGPDWDVGLTQNWLEFKGTPNEAPALFFPADIALFDDSGLTNNVNLTGTLLPGGVAVNNSTLNYTFYGSGTLGGDGAITKQGTGTLTLANTGKSSFRGGVTVEGGTMIFATDNAILGGISIASGTTVQVGTNGGTGNLPSGIVEHEGSLIFNHGTNLTVANSIGGSGSLTKLATGVLTLSGGNTTLTGAVSVAAGTLRAGSGSALGTVDGATTIANGATLDIGGQSLITEPFIVSGSGVGALGAIINSGADQINALGDVTLAGHTTFGGRFRFDIRGGAASLSTGGQAYNLTKIGTNQFSLVGVNVDPALANINVGNGSVFSVETTTASIGNPASTLTISNGATLQFFNTDNAIDKIFVLNGNGTTNTVNNASGNNTMAGAVMLTGNTIFNVGGTSLTLNGSVGGAGSLRKAGTSLLTLNGNNTYAGGTTNTAGTLILNGNNTGGGTLTNLATSSFGGRGTHAGPVQLGPNATLLPGGNTLAGTLGTGPLTLTSARTVFEIGTNNINSAVANDLVTVTGNLTLQGVTTNTVLAGPVGSLTNNQVITLFQYTGTLTGGTNNLLLIAPAGYELAFLNPTDTPGAIQIKVINAPAILTWRGHVAGSQTLWDIQTTTNWLDNGVLSDFLNLDGTVFDDSATTTTVNLTTSLSPSSVTMNNNTLNYTFTGSGKLSGSGPLTVQGGGTVILANSGSNDFSGLVNISSGTLQLGNGGAGGNLGSGLITNQSNLAFNRSGTLTVNNIHGSGSVSNLGSGVVTLGGANTYEGPLTVNQGTVRAGSGTALGSAIAGTFVASGATLDVGGQALNQEGVTVSGAGVGGGGAIVNTGADQLNAMGNVTLEGHTTFGGPGRWDIRGGAASLSTGGLPYNLTKLGPGQFSLVGVLVDAALGNIDVQGGIFAAETTTSSLGDVTRTLTVAAGATFQLFNSTVPFDKIFLLTGNGVANTINVSSGTGNTLIGPISLTGTAIVNVTGANALTLPGPGLINGSGGLAKNNTGTLNLSAPLQYAGDTTVNGGALIVSGDAALTNSPVVTLGAGALLDVTGLNNGPILQRLSGQTLQGNGNLNGSVTIAAGATLAPGPSIGVLTVTNNVNLNGTTVMEVQASPSTNDRLRSITGTITYGGTLVVTNLGPITGTNTYQLFQGALAGNSFANVILPTLPGVIWNTANLNVNGTITASQSVNLTPVNLAFSLTGSGLDISWPGSHTGWRLEGQTNSVTVGLSNNWVTVAGSAATNRVIVPFHPANGTVFFRLVYP